MSARSLFDDLAERSVRALARRSARRSFLGRLGAILVGAAAMPLLPVARGAQPSQGKDSKSAKPADPGDPAMCEYWRHCAIDGYLCSCCGGSQTACPPGTSMSAVTWIGTCHNPGDGKDYVISYNDCCGKGSCGRCFCNRNEGDFPLYQSSRSNDYNWCSGSSDANIPYHCSTARIVGAVH
jgi:methylamine dehydrogenase light chain